jgi:hypothetical protein
MSVILAGMPVFLLVAAIFGCGGDDNGGDATTTAAPTPSAAATATVTPTAVSSPSPTPTVTPSSAASVESGVELIDAIVRAVEQRDAAAVRERLHHFLAACTGSEGIGAIPCPAGQGPGAPVEVILTSSCEGSYSLKGDPGGATAVANFLATSPEFHAVALRSPANRDEVIPGDYVALFVRRAGPFAGGGLSLMIDEEGITWLAFGCGATPVEEMAGDNPEYLVPPRQR